MNPFANHLDLDYIDDFGTNEDRLLRRKRRLTRASSTGITPAVDIFAENSLISEIGRMYAGQFSDGFNAPISQISQII